MAKKKKKGFIYGIWNICLIVVCLAGLFMFFIKFIGDDKISKSRYPIKYDNIVSQYCDIYDVDKYLVQSIIRTESFFDSNAVSNKGAIGLMQIMPDTGMWIAEKLELENFTKEDLFDCEKNIMIGVWYLKYLSDRFNGNINSVIAAYNAGPTNVSKWLLQEELSSDGENLIDIPFSETKKYKDKVSSAYKMYLKLYEGI